MGVHVLFLVCGVDALPQVIDPKNFLPFHEYKPGFVLAEDMRLLKGQDDYLRIIFFTEKTLQHNR